MKYTKRGHEHNELTTKMLFMMENEPKEDDKIEMAMGSIAKHLKKGLQEDEIDATVDELNEVVARHLRQSREQSWLLETIPVATAPAPPPTYT